MTDEPLVSLRRSSHLGAKSGVTALLLASIVGLAAGALFISSSSFFVGNQNGTSSLSCGFVSLSTTNTVGSGLPSGTTYITFSPSLSLSAPVRTVSATPNLYGTGSQGSEYLDGEAGLGCSATPSTGTISMSVTFSGSGTLGTSATWVLMFLAPHSTNKYCAPGSQAWTGPAPGTCPTGTQSACHTFGSGPNIYLPNNGADTAGSSGNTYAWSWGTGAFDSGCSKSTPSNPFATSVSNSLSSMTVLYDISFAYGGVTAALGGSAPYFTLTETTTVS